MNFEQMNETDVREIIVRPLLHRLGYEQGTRANIRTEQTFRYEKTFLGRKKPNDPDLVGRADYILEVTSVGRWVVEAKGPSEPLTKEVVQQAHTYAAHPEVAALFFLITNGRSFHLYRTSNLDQPLMAWQFAETEDVFLAVQNLVGPEAICRRMKLLEPDEGKPLGKGIPSKVKIVGGFVRYEDHFSNHGLLDMTQINGLEVPVTSGSVERADNGRMHAAVKTANTVTLFGEFGKLFDRQNGYDFYSSDQYLSTDRTAPTIFQNFAETNAPAGTKISIPGMGDFPVPFSFRSASLTEAIGFVDGDKFMGTMQLSYEFFFDNMPPAVRMALEQQFGRFPTVLRAEGGGVFEVNLLTH